MSHTEPNSVPEHHPVAGSLPVTNARDVLNIEASDAFVMTPYVQDVTHRSLAYLTAGYPVHFAGPPGIGKTSLAFHIAAKLGRPVVLIHGDDELASSDLTGKDSGFRRSKTVDNFIHSVVKVEEEVKSLWVSNRLTTACQQGFTLIYDEFNRSRPETNNALLSVLSENMLNLPKLGPAGQGYISVHRNFRAIFTSNPEEYAGVHKAQDALLDRMITVYLDHYDRETEVEIVISRAEISRAEAETIVDIVRRMREEGESPSRPTIRAAIAIGRVIKCAGGHAFADDTTFRWVCRDVLSRDFAKITRDGRFMIPKRIDEIVVEICNKTAPEPSTLVPLSGE